MIVDLRCIYRTPSSPTWTQWQDTVKKTGGGERAGEEEEEEEEEKEEEDEESAINAAQIRSHDELLHEPATVAVHP
ncbi:hypothetical protein SprV_0301153500 [Sparganum proliferum]